MNTQVITNFTQTSQIFIESKPNKDLKYKSLKYNND